MNKLLTLLSSFLFTVGILVGQTVPVIITGTVADATGNGIPNLEVDIFTVNTFGFNYSNVVLTDSNGFYGDTILYPTVRPSGILYIETIDCDGFFLESDVFFETSSPVSEVVDLLYCDTLGGGGWPPFDSCGVYVTCDPDGKLVAEGFGEAPFTYLWNTGETTEIIIPQDTGVFCVTITDFNGCTSEGCSHFVGSGSIFNDTCSVLIVENGDTLTANVSGTTGIIFEWNTGDTSQSISPSSTGLYCVSIYDIDGCFAEDCFFYNDGLSNDSTCNVNVGYVPDLGGYFAAATGTEPFSYIWDDGSTNPFLLTIDAAIHCVTVVDANGCVAESCSDQGPIGGIENDISGYIFPSQSSQFPFFVTGTVLLIDAETGETKNTTNIVNLNGFPFYNFSDVEDGEYIVRVETIKPDGSAFIPTYHFETPLSSEAERITIPYASIPGVWDDFDVFVFDMIRRPGQGSISGNVTKVPRFGGVDTGRLTLDGISIILFDEGLEPIQYVKTDDNGLFAFSSLSWGTYHVYIDVPGHENAFFTVILGPNFPEVNDLNFNIYDGIITTSNGTSSIEELDYVNQVKISPNPTFGQSTIEFTSTKSGVVNLIISDVSGSILQSESLNITKATQRFEINLTNLNSGLYFVRLVDGNQSVTKRLIINI